MPDNGPGWRGESAYLVFQRDLAAGKYTRLLEQGWAPELHDDLSLRGLCFTLADGKVIRVCPSLFNDAWLVITYDVCLRFSYSSLEYACAYVKKDARERGCYEC